MGVKARFSNPALPPARPLLKVELQAVAGSPAQPSSPQGSIAITDHSCHIDANVHKNNKAQQQEQDVLSILGAFLVLITTPQGVMP